MLTTDKGQRSHPRWPFEVIDKAGGLTPADLRSSNIFLPGLFGLRAPILRTGWRKWEHNNLRRVQTGRGMSIDTEGDHKPRLADKTSSSNIIKPIHTISSYADGGIGVFSQKHLISLQTKALICYSFREYDLYSKKFLH